MLTEAAARCIVEGCANGTERRRRDARVRSDRFQRLAAAWLVGLGADRTRFAYGGDLDRFRSWFATYAIGSPLDASSADLEAFRDACASAGEADATVARRTSALRSFYRFAAAAGAITASPTVIWSGAVRTRAPRGALDATDVGALLGAADRLGNRTAALVGLLLFNGMRLDEVLGCDASDVTQRHGRTIVSLRRRDDIHVLELDRWTATAVRRYLGDRDDGPLLRGESPTRRDDRLSRFGADYLIKQAGLAAGIDQPMSSNTLRRSFVARAHGDGVPIEDIRDRLGHRDVRTTMRHLPGQDL